MIETTVEMLFQGAALGSVYGMIGAGLALIFGILKVVNLAHGVFITIGAFVAIWLDTLMPGVPAGMIFVAAITICALLGAALQYAVVERAMAFRDPAIPMIVTFGVSIVITNALVQVAGADLRSLGIGNIAQRSLPVGPFDFGLFPLMTLIFVTVVFVAVDLVMRKTRFGREVRALSDRPDIAALMGVKVKHVHAQVAALAAALAGIAGILLATRASVSPFSGAENLMIAFEVVVLGRLGSTRGALLAGIFLGIVQIVSLRFDSNAGLLYVHLSFFLILLFWAVTGKLK